ncbi:MAG: hypothetical protein RL385_3739 [Pseudomonadota bacterium]|jgi:hypothetical protein
MFRPSILCLLRVLPAAVVLSLAASITPNPSGIGTHVALGLPPCPVFGSLHVPCASCGLTSAVAALAHGDLLRSLAAQPLGLPLVLVAIADALMALVGLHHSAARGSTLWARLAQHRGFVAGVVLLTWAGRLLGVVGH